MEYNIEQSQEAPIDFKKYLFKLFNNWYWFAISLFFSFTVAYLINRYSEPIYKVSASVIVRDDERSKGLTGAENILEGMEMFKSKKNVQNEMGILSSYTLANRALKELADFEITYIAVGRRGIKEAKLYNHSPFYVELDSIDNRYRGYPIHVTLLSDKTFRLEINDQFKLSKKYQFGDSINVGFASFRIYLRQPETFVFNPKYSNKYYFFINNINSLTNSYRSRLSIEVNDKKGSILILSTTGFVAQQQVDYLNKLMEVYILSSLEEKNEIAVNTINFIDSQLASIADSLIRAELNLQDFHLRNKIVNLSSEGASITDKLSELEKEERVENLKLNYFEYLQNYILTRQHYEDIIAPSIMGVEDPLLNRLVIQLSENLSHRQALQYSTQIENPVLEQVIQQIESLIQIINENLKSNIKTSEMTLNELADQIEKTENRIQELPVRERQYINIERKFKLNNDIYNYLLEKRAESGIAKASNIPDNKILDRARLENASMIKPRKSMNYLLSILIGSMFPFLVIILIEYFNNTISDRKQIENVTSTPILGAIGHNRYDTEMPVAFYPKSSISESFRSLRTNLQFFKVETPSRLISISSTLSGEGKTFCALNLAIVISMLKKKTLLIGLDLRKPKLHKLFDMNNEDGLSKYLINETTFESIIRPTSIENLYLASSGPVPPNPSELIDSERMKQFLSLCKQEFEYIIMDTPPIAVVTDALIINKLADINLLVLRQRFSNKNILAIIEEFYQRKEMKNLSLIINDIKVAGYYGYDYGYGYGYTYGYRYGYGYGYSSQGDYYEEGVSKGLFRKMFQLRK
jgi:tyrosine-protein kinase Etk/Wzc